MAKLGIVKDEDGGALGKPRNVFRRFIQAAKLHGVHYALAQEVIYLMRKLMRLFVTCLEYLEYLKFLTWSPKQWSERASILRQFEKIHQVITCLHTRSDLLRIANYLLALPQSMEGDIIELGCANGGASCKLSIVAKLMGRKLVVCDSFSGLPAPRRDEQAYFRQGQYVATAQEVEDNIASLGEPDCVEVLPGWFNETLPNLRDRKFVAVFEDADLYESVVCCIENLWPSLQPGCRMFTHEHDFPVALQAYRDRLGITPTRVGGRLRRDLHDLAYVEQASRSRKSYER